MSFYSPFLRVWFTCFTLFHVRPLQSLGAVKAENGKSLPIWLLFAILLDLLPYTQAIADTVNSIRTFQHISTISSVAFSPNGDKALSGTGEEGAMKLWNVETGEEIRTFWGHSGYVSSVAFSQDGNTALSGSHDNTLKLWNVQTGQEIRTFTGHSESVSAVAFSPNGSTALSGSDRELKLWDVSTGEEIRTFSGHSSWVMAVAFSPNGSTALSCSADYKLKLWDVSTGEEIRTFSGHNSFVYSVAFSPDGRYALSGGSDKTLKLWSINTGQVLRTFTNHKSYVGSVVFSPDGRTALSGSGDSTLKLWDVQTGEEIRTFNGHNDEVNSVAFSPDGRYALSGSDDETMRLWETGIELTTKPDANDQEPHNPDISVPSCDIDSIEATEQSFNYEAKQDNQITVKASPGCQWLAKSNASWITISFGDVVVHGNGTILYSVKENTSHTSRSSTLTIANQTYKIYQEGKPCEYKITPTKQIHGSNMGTGSVIVDAASDCAWKAQTDTGWANITGGGVGQGYGTVTYQVMANTSSERREGKFTIAGQPFTLTQRSIHEKQPPNAEFFATLSVGQAPWKVKLNASDSNDPDGYITDYAWSVSDGKTASGEEVRLTFNKADTYTITLEVTDNQGMTATTTKLVTVKALTTRLINISTRAPIRGGDNNVIAGFIIHKSGTQRVLIRGMKMSEYDGVDPVIEVQNYHSKEVVARNNDWRYTERVSEIPSSQSLSYSTEAALLLDLPAGAYTAILSSNRSQGVGIIGIDAIGSAVPSVKVINISTRASIRGGDEDVIAGFIIKGTENMEVLIRGWGLETGVDPKLTVQKYPSGDFVASNDDWRDNSRASEIPTNLQLPKSSDAGLLLELPPGAYTAILSSVGSKGRGLIGVDEMRAFSKIVTE